MKINKIKFYHHVVIKFLKNRAAGHWIKSLSIVCSQNTESTHLQESVFPSAFGFREYGFLQVCTFPYSGNKQWITDNIHRNCRLYFFTLHIFLVVTSQTHDFLDSVRYYPVVTSSINLRLVYIT